MKHVSLLYCLKNGIGVYGCYKDERKEKRTAGVGKEREKQEKQKTKLDS